MKKQDKLHNFKSTDGRSGKKLILSSFFGTLVGTAVFLCLMLTFSAICLSLDNPHIFIYPLAFFSLYTSSFFAGFGAVKKNGSCDALLCGSISGVALMLIYIIIFAIISYFIPNTSSSTISFLWRALIIPASILGGYIATATHTKRSRRF